MEEGITPGIMDETMNNSEKFIPPGEHREPAG